MAEVTYNIIEKEEALITKKDALGVFNKIKSIIKDLPCDLKWAGGFIEKDTSYHDIDLSLVPKGEKTTPCVCITVAERFRKFEPKFPIDLYCEICGATMQWRCKGRWIYCYNPTTAGIHINWRKIRGARRGLHLFEFCELEKRLAAVEKFIMKGQGCGSHDFLNIGDFKPVDSVKVKKINLKNNRVEVILESNGREFSFGGGIFEVLPNMKKILVHWRDNVIPQILAVEKLSMEELEELVKKCEGMNA